MSSLPRQLRAVRTRSARPVTSPAFSRLCSWDNLLLAWRKAARGKRGTGSVAPLRVPRRGSVAGCRSSCWRGTYRPGAYVHFHIHEPKRRKISAAPFRDRVVHHALCNVIEPRFERLFIPDSYANRLGKGTHRAVDRLQQLAPPSPLRAARRTSCSTSPPSTTRSCCDTLRRQIPEADVMALVEHRRRAARGVLDEEYRMVCFPGDDLLAACRPRGLPIGNLTSQFWSNCYLHPFDQFVTRELRLPAYLRYVDDFALFSDSKRELWAWKARDRRAPRPAAPGDPRDSRPGRCRSPRVSPGSASSSIRPTAW